MNRIRPAPKQFERLHRDILLEPSRGPLDHIEDDTLVAYSLKMLAPELTSEVAVHLAACVECTALLGRLTTETAVWETPDGMHRLNALSDQILASQASVAAPPIGTLRTETLAEARPIRVSASRPWSSVFLDWLGMPTGVRLLVAGTAVLIAIALGAEPLWRAVRPGRTSDGPGPGGSIEQLAKRDVQLAAPSATDARNTVDPPSIGPRPAATPGPGSVGDPAGVVRRSDTSLVNSTPPVVASQPPSAPVATLSHPVATSTPTTPPSSEDRKPRIAILDFDYAPVANGVQRVFGRTVDVGQGMSDLLVKSLLIEDRFVIVERSLVNRVLAEQGLSPSDRFDPSVAARIGRLLGVDAVLVGSITQFGNQTRDSGSAGMGKAVGKIGIGGFGQATATVQVGINARLIDVGTAEVVAVSESIGESKRTATSFSGIAAGWSPPAEGRVDLDNQSFQATIIGEAVKRAVDSLATDVLARSALVRPRAEPNWLVAAVAGNQLILNIGTKAGLRLGDQLSVIRVTQEVRDPASGMVLRSTTTRIGIVKVTEVDADSAIADVVSGAGFRVRDIVTKSQ